MMPVHQNSLDNLRPIPAYPVGAKRQVGRYWMVKLPNGKWKYTHKLAAEKKYGRPVRPNERVYFLTDDPEAKIDPQPSDIEIRPIPPRNGVPPGERKKLIRRYLQMQHDLELVRQKLAKVNAYFGKAPDDLSDSGLPADWKPRPPRPLSGLEWSE